MKISQQFAESFAAEWVAAWNSRDIERIMQHYDDAVVFSSPFIIRAKINEVGTIQGKAALRSYFEHALNANPDIHFDLKHIMVGAKSINLIYIRKRVMLASEVMILNDSGKVIEGLSHYPVEDIGRLSSGN